MKSYGAIKVPVQTARAIPAAAESSTTATEPALSPKRADDAPLKLPEMDGEAALPLALPLALPAADEPAALVPVTVVPKPEPVGVVVTVTPKPEVVAGGVYVIFSVVELPADLLDAEADDPAAPEPDADADAEEETADELLAAATLKEPLVA